LSNVVPSSFLSPSLKWRAMSSFGQHGNLLVSPQLFWSWLRLLWHCSNNCPKRQLHLTGNWNKIFGFWNLWAMKTFKLRIRFTCCQQLLTVVQCGEHSFWADFISDGHGSWAGSLNQKVEENWLYAPLGVTHAPEKKQWTWLPNLHKWCCQCCHLCSGHSFWLILHSFAALPCWNMLKIVIGCCLADVDNIVERQAKEKWSRGMMKRASVCLHNPLCNVDQGGSSTGKRSSINGRRC